MSPESVEPSWPGIYLQVAIALAVFGAGVPALGRTFMSENVQRVAQRRSLTFRLTWMLSLLPVFLSLVILWRPYASVTDGLFDRRFADAALTTSIVVVAILVWQQLNYRREMLVKRVAADGCRQALERGQVDQTVIDDLVALGAEPGHSGASALRALELVASTVQEHRAYLGHELEPVVAGMEAVTCSQRTLEGLLAGLSSLMRLAENIKADAPVSKADAQKIGRAAIYLQEVAVAEFRTERPFHAALQVLDVVARRAPLNIPSCLFVIGLNALEKRRYLTAVAALSRLEAIVWQLQPLANEDTVYYLGLLAHLFAVGEAGRDRVFASLRDVDFRSDLQSALQVAKSMHAASARFVTVDLIAQLERSDVIQGIAGKSPGSLTVGGERAFSS